MKISLQTLVNALDTQTDTLTRYLDTQTGEIVSVTDEDALRAADKLDWDDLSRTQQDAVRAARTVAAGRGATFLELPAESEINPRGLMREFAADLDLDNPVAAEDLARALRSKDATRRFHDTLATYGLAPAWHVFHDDALRRLALAWCEENGLETG